MNNNPITLISSRLFRLHSPITDNTGLTEFVPYLSIAQELYIAPVLGQLLTAELKEQIASNSLTTKNSDLLIKIAPALSFYAVYQGLPFHWASIVNKGVTVRESENSRGVDVKDIAQLRRWIRDDADIFISLLVDYLCTNRADYPQWKPSDECLCNNQTRFDSGFYFPHN